MKNYKAFFLAIVFTISLVSSVFFWPLHVMAESRQLTAIVNTTGYKPDGSATLTLDRGKSYPVNLVTDTGNFWTVELGSNAGRWKFKKSDIDFHQGAYPLTLSDFKGGDRIATIKAIVSECKRFGLSKSQCSYVLATAHHESNFQPVIEAYWMSAAWRKANLRYWPWIGRGYVQLTWYWNYLKYERITGIKLTQNPDLALQPNVSLYILVHGMKFGNFTGVSLENYINSKRVDFVNARRIVNGMDRARDIASIANYWYKQLTVY